MYTSNKNLAQQYFGHIWNCAVEEVIEQTVIHHPLQNLQDVQRKTFSKQADLAPRHKHKYKKSLKLMQ